MNKSLSENLIAAMLSKDSGMVSKNELLRRVVQQQGHIQTLMAELFIANPHHHIFRDAQESELAPLRLERVARIGRYVEFCKKEQ